MPYPSPADEERNGGCGPILAAVVLLFIVLAAASCTSQAMGAQDVTVRQARTDGPIYDLPEASARKSCATSTTASTCCLPPSRAACSSCRTWTRTASRRSCRRPRTQRSRPVWSGFFYSTSNTNARLTTNTCICSPTEQLVEARRIELRSTKAP